MRHSIHIIVPLIGLLCITATLFKLIIGNILFLNNKITRMSRLLSFAKNISFGILLRCLSRIISTISSHS